LRLVSPVLRRVVYPGLSRAGYLRRRQFHEPVAVTYHGVLPPLYRAQDTGIDANLLRPEALQGQIRFLKANYDVIAPGEFLAWCEGRGELPERPVLLTCDDGLRNCAEHMLPVLRDEGVVCLFFITGASLQERPALLWHEKLYLMLLAVRRPCELNADDFSMLVQPDKPGKIGSVHWQLIEQLSKFSGERRAEILEEWRLPLGLHEGWEEKFLADEGGRSRFLVMEPGQLLELKREGMELGAHTDSHPALSRMPEGLARTEIEGNRRCLERLVGEPIRTFAYPFGNEAAVGAREWALTAESGFSCAFMNCEGKSSSRFALPRVHITADMTLAELEARVSGFHCWLRNFAGKETMGALWQ